MSDRRNIRVYAAVRTVHLERLAESHPAELLYTKTRYDFDESVLADSVRPERVGRFGAVRHLLRHGHGVVEINEPFMVARWIDLLAQVAAVTIRSMVDRERSVIVTYVLSLKDPAADLVQRWRLPRPIADRLARLVIGVLVRRTDRIAFGTEAARDLMVEYVDPDLVAARGRVFPALPTRCRCVDDGAVTGRREPGAVFVGAFDERKGIRQLLAAWELVADRRPDATLTLIGKGALTAEVEAWAHDRREVSVVVDPPRAHIHDAMRVAGVLILLSQRRGVWREQVGLPIVEGLSHGCRIVATDETGLASWLRDHRHVVVAGDAAADVTAAAIEASLTDGPSPADVLADLPEVDMRLVADRWMFTGEASIATGAEPVAEAAS